MKQVYLLTGRPGSGKTSFIKQAVTGMGNKAGGFYTEEIRSRGARQGFRLVTLYGQSVVLAHINIKSPYRVSKYGVDIESLDKVGVWAIKQAAREDKLVVIDEIGKMELFSLDFRETVLHIINRGKKVLGTIMSGPNPWADAIKLKPQVNLVEVSSTNRHQVREELLSWLKQEVLYKWSP